MSNKSINRRLNIFINGKEVKNSLQAIQREMSKLRGEVKGATRGTEEYKQKTAELRRVSKVYREMRQEIYGTTGALGKLTSIVGKLGIGLGIGYGVSKAIDGLRNLTRVNADFSDSLADVKKTTGLTDSELQKLTKTLKKMDTRTPLEGLMGIAEEAGRLGKKSRKDIEDFVRVADKIAVALGDDLNGDINENVRVVGKMVEQYRVGAKEGAGFGKSMDMLGSALNEVSASGSNQAGFLLDFMKRTAGAGRAARISAGDIIGYAAALDEAGQSVEVSGTTMNKVLLDMFTNTEKYAKVAGMEVGKFSELLQNDANAAMLKFLEGVGKDNAGLKQMAGHFKKLGLSSARAVAVLTSLASNTEKIHQKQELANKSMKQATSLTAEFNQKNNNLAGNLEKVGKWMTNLFINSSFRSGLNSLVSGFLDLVGATEKVSDKIKEEQVQLGILESKIRDTNITQSERLKLIKEFQKKYPGFLHNLDAEVITNDQLSEAIGKVNDELVKKLALQLEDEKIQKRLQKLASMQRSFSEQQIKVQRKLSAYAKAYNLTLKKGTVLEQATYISKKIDEIRKKRGEITGGRLTDAVTEWQHQVGVLKAYNSELLHQKDVLSDLEKKKKELADAMGIGSGNKIQQTNFSHLFSQAFSGTSKQDNKSTSVDDNSDKKTTKYINQAKRLQAELTRIQNQGQTDRLALLQEGYDKELQTIEVEFEQKKQKLEDQLVSASEIKKLHTRKEKDLARQLNKEIADQIAQNEKIKQIKIATLQEKYANKYLDNEKKKYDRELRLLKTSHNEQLAAIKTFEQLKKYFTPEELKKFKTVQEGKKALADKFRKEEYDAQIRFLEKMQKLLQDTLNNGEFQGMHILSEEEKNAILARIEEIGLEISKLKAGKQADTDTADTSVSDTPAGGLDILGYSVEDWEQTFEKLDTVQQKIAAAEMVVHGLMNAWQMYNDYMRAANERELSDYEKGLEKKKKKLKEQLDNGYLTKAQYQRKLEKLDQDLDKKKAELAYNNAKREKEMNLFNAITNTALGVIKATTAPFPMNTWLPFLIGAIGAAQIATIASAPLPPKFAQGGYTDGLGYTDETGHEVAGIVHAGEYVVPNFVMSDPTVPALIQYLEAKRTGQSYAEGGNVTQPDTDTSTNTGVDMLTLAVNRLNATIDKGIEAHLIFGNREALEVQELIDENKKLRNDARL